MNFKEGQRVSVSVKTLYENGGIEYGTIVPDYNDNKELDYYDLYNADGELSCMDGETCIVSKVNESSIEFENSEGETVKYFTLSTDEANEAVVISPFQNA